jgi:predicted helicase
MSEALQQYVKGVEAAYRAGTATEHTYRSYLKNLLETLSPGIVATNEPKHIKHCGAPDFIVTRNQTPLGYLETKDLFVSLDQVERTDQMRRYLGGLANLILTDYLEFRWYVAGQHRMTARLVTVAMGGKSKGKSKAAGSASKWNIDAEGCKQVTDLLQGFLLAQAPTVTSPKELAVRMAAIAQLIRNAISLSFKSEAGAGSLHGQLEGFRQVLLPDLDAEQFADMYAQTICYGLFAARFNTKPGRPFAREYAAYDIPKTNPFLRKMFNYIAGPDLDERIVWAVDDLASVLAHTDMEAILRDFGRRTRQEDPVVHFYETFLAHYDSKMREARGVYYTPEPVVSYIVRSVDALLKRDFGLPMGLADATKVKMIDAEGHAQEMHRLQILDPATGTGTFLHSVVDLIYETFKGNKGIWSTYVSQHLLPRMFGFELLMAPYAVAHMKLGLQLAETGYDFKGQERLGVYLTNTLEEGFGGGKLQLPFVEWLVDEATAAGSVKYTAPVMVVLGNPPYSGHSANKGEWIKDLLHGKDTMAATGAKVGDYFKVDGKELGERNPKWLNDDYVKFIRFAQWRIERTGYGILAFITNHGYLDNPTFRGMRQTLMQSFDDIYVLNLHGNSKKKERALDGTKDENVFDIQQGVAIGIFVKRKSSNGASHAATVHYADLWGVREVFEQVGNERKLVRGKYHWLAAHDVQTTEWTKVEPQAPLYLFSPQGREALAEYEQGYKLTSIFGTGNPKQDSGKRYGLGICTHNDLLHIAWSEAELINRVQQLASETIPDSVILETLPVSDSRYWNTHRERAKIRKSNWRDKLLTVYYRPLDWRKIYYEPDLMEIGRGGASREVMGQAKQSSRNLMVSKGYEIETFEHILVSNAIAVHHAATRKEGNYFFPLYLYPNDTSNASPSNIISMLDVGDFLSVSNGRRPNLAPAFIADITSKLGMGFVADGHGDLDATLGPEDIFAYMYAVFHSPTYRTRYAEFLKIDFPRLPLTTNAELFRALCRLGERLVALHLMEQDGATIARPRYPIQGSNVVEKVEYREAHDETVGRVYINATQYFEGVPLEVWEFHVGGYQVCQKWLKDRKGRVLDYDDVVHYQRVVTALAETIVLMERVDEAIEEGGGWPIG